jgi:hypothetical protein
MSQPRKSFRTPKGSELPLLNMRGKEYLQVAHRLVWFREDHPRGTIKTQLIEKGGEGKDEYAVFRAEVFVDTERGAMLVATAHKKETRAGFDDFIEKAETGALGRALAMMGYGTQFTADELDEGQRLADSPVEVITKPAEVATASTSSAVTEAPAKRASFRKRVSAASVTDSSSEDI